MNPLKIVKSSFVILFAMILLVFLVGVGSCMVDTIENNNIAIIVVNEHNGDIVISYDEAGDELHHWFIDIYDVTGQLKKTYKFDNAGKGIYEIAYDDNDDLYLFLSQLKYHVRISPDGTYEKYVDASNVEYPTGDDYWEKWEKSGSSYVQTQGNNTYVYDYPSFFDYYTTPVWEIYIVNEAGQKITVLSSNFA